MNGRMTSPLPPGRRRHRLRSGPGQHLLSSTPGSRQWRTCTSRRAAKLLKGVHLISTGGCSNCSEVAQTMPRRRSYVAHTFWREPRAPAASRAATSSSHPSPDSSLISKSSGLLRLLLVPRKTDARLRSIALGWRTWVSCSISRTSELMVSCRVGRHTARLSL